jgi:hypothetical protein
LNGGLRRVGRSGLLLSHLSRADELISELLERRQRTFKVLLDRLSKRLSSLTEVSHPPVMFEVRLKLGILSFVRLHRSPCNDPPLVKLAAGRLGGTAIASRSLAPENSISRTVGEFNRPPAPASASAPSQFPLARVDVH